MPFTPFHFGIASVVFAILPFLDPLSLFVGAVIPDIEGITALFILPSAGLPLHGPFHSFLGAIVLGIMVGGTSYLFWRVSRLDVLLEYTPLSSFTLTKSIASGILGAFSHIMLDAPLYSEMNPFLPLLGNLLFGVVPSSAPYLICILSFFVGVLILFIRFIPRE